LYDSNIHIENKNRSKDIEIKNKTNSKINLNKHLLSFRKVQNYLQDKTNNKIHKWNKEIKLNHKNKQREDNQMKGMILLKIRSRLLLIQLNKKVSKI
jgi:hypothetical protein